MIQDPTHMAAKTTEIATYTTGLGTLMGGVSGWLDNNAVAIGAACAIVTCAANLYFRYREYRIFKREHGDGN